MSKKVEENIQEAVNLAATGHVDIDTVEGELRSGIRKLDRLRQMQEDDDD